MSTAEKDTPTPAAAKYKIPTPAEVAANAARQSNEANEALEEGRRLAAAVQQNTQNDEARKASRA